MHTQHTSGLFSGIGKNGVARSWDIKLVFLLSDIQQKLCRYAEDCY